MKKEAFFDRSPAHYYGPINGEVADYCKTHFKEDVAHILRVADEVCEGIFLFDLKWDMERTYEPVCFKGRIDWNFMPKDDPEFIWQFNRHRFFICLGQAYQLTGDEKYAKTFVRLVTEWIEDVPRKEPFLAGPWRSLETGLRGENWNKALRFFRDSPEVTEDFLDLFYQSMEEHAEHLMSCHSVYRYMSNWGVIENHGLFEISVMLPQSEKTARYRAFALKNLEVEARMQILGDGVQWEQSPMYHNEVLHCYYDVILLAKRNDIELPESILNNIHKMAYANLDWKKPNHHQPMMGDSDDTDIRDLISVGAYLFKDPVLKFGGLDRLDFESIWDLGMAAEAEYEALETKVPDFTSIGLMESGNYILRTSWEEDANYLRFHCGTLGAGHGHSDQLHIDLVIHGEDVLVDGGRYTYVAGDARYEFKDPAGHNTLTVDDELFTICQDSWECCKLSQPVKQQFVTKNGYGFIQGGHLGYMENLGVYVNRKIIQVDSEIYVMVDECYGKDAHTYQEYFHFNETGKVSIEGNTAFYQGDKAVARFTFLSDDTQLELGKSRVSRNYNEAIENDCLKVSRKGGGQTNLITVIQGGEGALETLEVSKVPVYSALKGKVYPEHMAEGIKLSLKDKTYLVAVCHQEVNSPTDLVQIEDCMGYGNVIVFEPEKDQLVGTVLHW